MDTCEKCQLKVKNNKKTINYKFNSRCVIHEQQLVTGSSHSLIMRKLGALI